VLAEIGALVRRAPVQFSASLCIHWIRAASPDARLLARLDAQLIFLPWPSSPSAFLSLFQPDCGSIYFFFGALFPPCSLPAQVAA